MKRIKFHPVVNVHGLMVMVDATVTPGRAVRACADPDSQAYSDPGEPLEVEYDHVILADWPNTEVTQLFTEFDCANKWLCDEIVKAWQGCGVYAYRTQIVEEIDDMSGPDGPVADSVDGYKVREGEET